MKLRFPRGVLRETLVMALDSVRSHKFRSFLTVLGIVIGVMTAITIASILTGLRQNIVATNGLIFAESLAFALNARLGRARGSEALGRAIQRRADSGTTLRAALEADPTVTATLSDDELSAVFDVRRTVRVAEQVARRVAAVARGSVGPAAKPR